MYMLPKDIIDFINKNHVVGLSVYTSSMGLWAASCFYVFSEEHASLLILSEESTRHGQSMKINPQISGTIAGQPLSIKDIQGVQFEAEVRLLNKKESDETYNLYQQRFPFVQLQVAPMWQLNLLMIKFTDNKKGFGYKQIWRRV